MKIGTRSVLFGAHQFILHPLCLALAWRRLYGMPWDPRLWLCFFLHDFGYIGMPNMDGKEGREHPLRGARWVLLITGSIHFHDLCLFHSRHFCKARGRTTSRLCVADKLAFVITPRWIYLLSTGLTGELAQYVENGRKASPTVGFHTHWCLTSGRPGIWHAGLRRYMLRWVACHRRDGEKQWAELVHAHRARDFGPA